MIFTSKLKCFLFKFLDIETYDNLQYVFFPVSSSAVRFKVKAMNDAHVALTRGPYESEPMTEIHIGGWDNTKSIIRRNRQEPDKIKVPTPRILNRNEYVGMWIRWHNGCIAAGLEGSSTPFIFYEDPSPHPIDHMAVRTGWGSSGSWIVEVTPVIYPEVKPMPLSNGELYWVSMLCGDPMPPDAVIGGYEDEILYVARARHHSSLCPGKYVPSLQQAVVPYGHRAHKKDKFEILCGFNYLWVKTNSDLLPPHAFSAGVATERQNETTYIGRAYIDTHLIPGKIHLHYKTCYFPRGRHEMEVNSYEVLVVPDKLYKQLTWIQPVL